MEKLTYIIEDSTIAKLLGVQNFTNKESAILELVKNAFDAKADKLTIEIYKNEIILTDNGDGMNENDIRENWMHIGRSNKEYNITDNNGNQRILAGSKGIGRFALARLGKNIKIYSQKTNFTPILWTTDWNTSYITNVKENINIKTRIKVTNLRDSWSEKAVHNLIDFLSRSYNDSLMTILIKGFGIEEQVYQYFNKARLGYNCLSIINLEFNSDNCSLAVNVKSDEFDKKSLKYYHGDITNHTKTINILDSLSTKESVNNIDSIQSTLNLLGNFTAELYFTRNVKVTEIMKERFLYKNMKLPDNFKKGIILYRNSFSISSYEGLKDWIGLNTRSRKSPAAASHPTGAWRVRENQISGKIAIDKNDNKYLQDLSNRQGLDNNIYYEIFLQILDLGLKEFELYRQSIIRSINKKNIEDTPKKNKIINEIIKNPNIINKLDKKTTNRLVDELRDINSENQNFKTEIKNTENRYKYDTRILNVLATLGLKASSMAHEMKNDQNIIRNNRKYIINTLKKLELWDIVNNSENTRLTYSNIPKLLDQNQKVNDRFIRFTKIMLDEIEKEKFTSNLKNINEVLFQLVEKWHRDYSLLEINIKIEKILEFNIPEDLLVVIIDNLILNSVQQNKISNKFCINLNVYLNNNKLFIEYKDNGLGLAKKYINDPFRILEVHETSREKGHGLGMWIVNNSINYTKGEIIDIDGKNGFKIKFYLGGNL